MMIWLLIIWTSVHQCFFRLFVTLFGRSAMTSLLILLSKNGFKTLCRESTTSFFSSEFNSSFSLIDFVFLLFFIFWNNLFFFFFFFFVVPSSRIRKKKYYDINENVNETKEGNTNMTPKKTKNRKLLKILIKKNKKNLKVITEEFLWNRELKR